MALQSDWQLDAKSMAREASMRQEGVNQVPWPGRTQCRNKERFVTICFKNAQLFHDTQLVVDLILSRSMKILCKIILCLKIKVKKRAIEQVLGRHHIEN